MPPKVRISEKERGMRANKGSVSTDGAKAFISFSEVASTTSTSSFPSHSQPDTVTTNLSPIYLGDDIDLSVITKKLTKKNPVSRLKALQELKALLQLRGSEVVTDLAPFFVFIYNRLVLENQNNIREESNVVLELLMTIDKKAFAVHMKHLIAPWYFSTCDPGREIGARAQGALEVAFPPKKRREVLTFFSAVVLRYLLENINNATPESLTDSSMSSSSEAEDRYERVISGSYAALARFLCWLFPTSATVAPAAVLGAPLPASAKGAQPLPLPADTTALLSEELDISFFKKTTSKRAYVRHGALDVLTAVCAQCPHLLLPHSGDEDVVPDYASCTEAGTSQKKGKQPPLGRLSMIVCNAFVNEKESNNMTNAFRAFLAFSKAFPAAWRHLDFRLVATRLIDLLTRNEKESATVELAMSYVLPLLASVPLAVVRREQTSVLQLCETLASITLRPPLLKGTLRPTIALIEFCTYFIIQFGKEESTREAGVKEESEDISATGFGNVFIPRLIEVSVSKCIEEWKMQLDHKRGAEAESTIVSMLCALHRADTREGVKQSWCVSQYWSVLSSRVVDEMRTQVEQVVACGDVTRAEQRGAGISFEFNVLFFDNIMSSLEKGIKSVAAVSSSAVGGLFKFLDMIIQTAELCLQERTCALRWTRLCWMHVALRVAVVVMEIAPALRVMPSNRLLSILSSKQWLLDAVDEMSHRDDDTELRRFYGNFEIKSFALELVKKSFAVIVTLKGDDAEFLHRGCVLAACQESKSLLGICVAIDSGLLSAEMVDAGCFDDSKSELYSIGALLREVVSSLCAPPTASRTVSEMTRIILSIDQNSQVQFLVQCQENKFLNDFTNASSLLHECLQENMDAIERSMDVNHPLTVSHWALLTVSRSRLRAEQELLVTESLVLSQVMTLVFLNRNELSPMAAGVWPVIASWRNVQDELFSLCPPVVVDMFTRQVVNFLNTRLCYGVEVVVSSAGGVLGPVSAEEKFCASADVVGGGWASCMSADVWAEHATCLLRVCHQHPTMLPLSKVAQQLGFHSVALWSGLLNKVVSSMSSDEDADVVTAVECFCFVIHCLFHVDTDHEGTFAQLLPITTDVHLAVTVFQLLVVGKYALRRISSAMALTARDDLHDLLECCQALISTFVNSSKDNVWSFTKALFSFARPVVGEEAAVLADEAEYLRQFSLLEAISLAASAAESFGHKKGTPIGRPRLALDTPLYSDVILKDTVVCYVSIEERETGNDGGVDDGDDNVLAPHRTLRAVLASLVSTHRDDGPNNPAFYTIKLTADDRELQTEAKRIILTGEDGRDCRPPVFNTTDIVGTMLLASSREETALSTVLKEVMSWLCESVQLTTSTTSSATTTSLRADVSHLGLALHHVLSVLSREQNELEEMFVGHCRQVCLSLLEEKLADRLASVLLGLELLCSLLAPASLYDKGVGCGMGNGLWVGALLIDRLEGVLIGLTTTSRLVLSSAGRRAVLILACRVMKELLPVVQNRRLSQLAEEFCKLALACIQSLQAEEHNDASHMSCCLLSDALVQCLAALWTFPSTAAKKGIAGMKIDSKSAVGDSLASEENEEEGEEGEGGRSWASVYHSDLDLNGLKHCFHVLFSHLRCRSLPSSDRSLSSEGVNIPALVTAVDRCLQNQLQRGGRQAGAVLLQAAGLTMCSSSSKSSAAHSGDRFDDVFVLSVIGDPHVDSRVRVLFTKMLDILFTNQTLLASVVGEPPAAIEVGVEGGEQDELLAGEKLTRQLLGDCLFEMFQARARSHVPSFSLPADPGSSEDAAAGYVKCCAGACPIQSTSSHLDESSPSLSESFGRRSLALSGCAISLHESKYLTCTPISGNDYCSDTLGLVLLHLLLLQKIDTVCTSASTLWTHQRAAIGLYLTQNKLMAPVLKVVLDAQNVLPVPVATDDFVGMFGCLNPCLFHCSGGGGTADVDIALGMLFAYTLYRSTCLLPVATRTYWNDHCSRSQRVQLEKFIETRINKNMVKREVAIVKLAEQQGRVKSTSSSSSSSSSLSNSAGTGSLEDEDGGITIRCSAMTQEFITTFTADEVSIEMTIRLPVLYPLRNVEVECTRKMGISEGRWRRWILQIIQLLSHQDGSVLDAILLWKKNVDKEFEGVEPCPICYSILHPKTLSLPTLCCPTCKNKFHSPCLYKWFNSSGKSKCVLCQQPFF